MALGRLIRGDFYRRLLIVRNLRHRGDLDKVEVPQDADPHDAAQDMQPAHKERPPGFTEARTAEREEHDDREHETRDHGVAKICQNCGHAAPHSLVNSRHSNTKYCVCNAYLRLIPVRYNAAEGCR